MGPIHAHRDSDSGLIFLGDQTKSQKPVGLKAYQNAPSWNLFTSIFSSEEIVELKAEVDGKNETIYLEKSDIKRWLVQQNPRGHYEKLDTPALIKEVQKYSQEPKEEIEMVDRSSGESSLHTSESSGSLSTSSLSTVSLEPVTPDATPVISEDPDILLAKELLTFIDSLNPESISRGEQFADKWNSDFSQRKGIDIVLKSKINSMLNNPRDIIDTYRKYVEGYVKDKMRDQKTKAEAAKASKVKVEELLTGDALKMYQGGLAKVEDIDKILKEIDRLIALPGTKDEKIDELKKFCSDKTNFKTGVDRTSWEDRKVLVRKGLEALKGYFKEMKKTEQITCSDLVEQALRLRGGKDEEDPLKTQARMLIGLLRGEVSRGE